ncbi:YdeI/OmpD-associated family protein [Angustibacter luteus]|uniref:YdeI/OmpD-associated family protein n=1 Tax=Angustibacter luteus TaxID=658456 RepID=A0ABW1JDP1_9ACTN
MTEGAAEAVAFRTTIAGSGGKAGIVVPDDVIQRLGAGRRPAVHVDLDGFGYRSTVAVMGGTYLIGVNASVRQATGLEPGHPVTVTLAVATAPREVIVPEDFAAALAADQEAQTFFDGLSNSIQRYHIDNINSAKTPETRARRIQKAVSLFREGKQR